MDNQKEAFEHRNELLKLINLTVRDKFVTED